MPVPTKVGLISLVVALVIALSVPGWDNWGVLFLVVLFWGFTYAVARFIQGWREEQGK